MINIKEIHRDVIDSYREDMKLSKLDYEDEMSPPARTDMEEEKMLDDRERANDMNSI